ncbi:hypothetical protein GUITHDRAFT_153178, partial [Guillardia theta CCMP2712]
EQDHKEIADWDVWWLCHTFLAGIAVSPYDSWEQSHELQEAKQYATSIEKCLCLKRAGYCELGHAMKKDGLFCNARSKCCCRHGQNQFFPLICEDKTELEGMSGEHGFVSCIERSLCILGTCSLVPKKFFVECCGSRVMGSPKEAQALPQNEPQPEAQPEANATVTFGGASFGHAGNRAMEGEI